MRIVVFFLCAAAVLCVQARASDIDRCPSFAVAEKNLKLHNYKISKLSPAGMEQVVSYMSRSDQESKAWKAVPGLVGYFASTTFYQFVDNGQATGGVPADRAMIVLFDGHNKCVAQMGGTIEQVTAILDGSAARLSRSFAQ